MNSIDHHFGNLEYTWTRNDTVVKLFSVSKIILSSAQATIFPFSQTFQHLSRIISSQVWVTRNHRLQVVLHLNIDDVSIRGCRETTLAEHLAMSLCQADVQSSKVLRYHFNSADAPKMWNQLSVTAKIKTVSQHSIHTGAAIEISLILASQHGLAKTANNSDQSISSFEVQSPPGVPFVTLERVEFAIKVSGCSPTDLIHCDEENEMLDDYPCSASLQTQVYDAIRFPSQSSRYISYPCSQQSSVKLSQTSRLSSQSSISPLTASSEGSNHFSKQQNPSRSKFDTTDLVKLVDILMRRTLFGHKLARSGEIIVDNDMHCSSLCQLSPSIFCPGYHEVRV